MINLKVKKETFEKNIIPLGYNYKIKQYEDFIESIQRVMFNEIEGSENKKEAVEKVFKDEPSYFVAFDSKEIKYINKEYLVELIEQGLLDLYLEEKEVVFTDKQLEAAYLMKLAKDQNTKLSRKYISEKFMNKNKFNLITVEAYKKGLYKESEEIKREFYIYLYEKASFNSFDFEVNFYNISPTIQDNIALILKENNFLFGDINQGKVKYVKNTLVFQELEEYYYESSLQLLANKFFKEEIKYISDIRRELSKKNNYLTIKEEDKITKLISKVCKLKREDILDIELVISNEKNEIRIKLNELI